MKYLEILKKLSPGNETEGNGRVAEGNGRFPGS
jgi:hypothetical protein